MTSLTTQVRCLIAAVLAGALGGALLAMGESALVSWTSGDADEYWMVLFGTVAYGVLGAGIGLGAGVLWQLVRRGRASEDQVAQVAIAAALGLPVLAVGRYYVAQHVFREGLVLFSAAGMVAHVLLLIGAIAAALLGIAAVRGLHRVGGAAATAAALAVLVGGAAVIGWATDATKKPAIARRPAPAAAAGKPNIILVVADTLRADAVTWSREQLGPQSGFGQVAADGVAFEHAYVQSSWTRPSIATILTAEYPSAHGTVHKMDFLPERAETIAEALKKQGYWTAAFTTNINVAPIFNFQQGFDEFTYLEPSFYFGASDSATRLAVYKGLRAAREKLSDAMYVGNYYQDAVIVDRHVEAWLGEQPPEPFFLFVHYMDPHDPYFEMPYNGRGVARVSTPEPAASRVEELHALYRLGVRYLDGYLHALVGRLNASGLYDRSVIAFTADHGEEFHEHGGWWHGTTLYEEQVHVPLIIKRAREPQPGRRRADWARSVDIAPTLLAAAGLHVPAQFQGIDLFAGTVNEPLLAEEDLEGNRLSAIRIGPWKLITANADNPRGLAPTELYNLDDDPGERRNLAAAEKDRVSELLAQLEQLRARLAAGGRSAGGTARIDAVDPRS